MRRLPLALNSFAAALCIIIGTQRADAQAVVPTNDVPRTVSYQGLLTSTDGAPVHDGEYRITLALYADPAGTIKVWEDTYNTPITDGIFNVYLGSGNMRLPDPATLNRPLWVGTRIDDGGEMRPLTPLSASPYALNVPDRAITTGKLADGAVTADKVDMDYIAGIAVNGQPVAAKGSLLNLEGSSDIALTYNDETNTLRLSRPTPATRGDGEKGSEVMATNYLTSDNWLGRDGGANLPFYDVPNALTSTYNTLVAGYANRIADGTDYSTIVGGQENFIDENTEHAFIGGGQDNIIYYEGDYSTIGGGQSNIIDPEYQWAFIGGGDGNQIEGSYAVIGGGEDNRAAGFHVTIGGGAQQTAIGHNSTIGGGENNYITGNGVDGFIGGGRNHFIHNSMAVIGGGSYDTVTGYGAIIGGGSYNKALADYSAILGGDSNTVSARSSIIGGGYDNLVEGEYALIGGGDSNTVLAANYAGITGGQYNKIQYDADHSAIGGGQDNLIEPESQWAFIGGGDNNTIEGSYAVIGGGEDNQALNFYTTIGGGIQNTATGYSSTIAGGENNSANGTATKAFIGGGQNNNATNANAVIGGGEYHAASGANSSIGGGSYNTASGDFSAIPGGNHLQATNYGTSAVGFYNRPRGTVPGMPATGTARSAINDPLFMVGNGVPAIMGGPPVTANAFEVSYNGHTTVYGTNMNGATNSPIRGATYTDNIVYAWGNIGIFGAINADFGVVAVNHPAAGVYEITVNIKDPVTGAVIPLGPTTPVAITATLVANPQTPFTCGDIRVTGFGVPGPNQFTVYTIGAPTSGHCEGLNSPFMFHVTGRP